MQKAALDGFRQLAAKSRCIAFTSVQLYKTHWRSIFFDSLRPKAAALLSNRTSS
jgi:hypothetical protein